MNVSYAHVTDAWSGYQSWLFALISETRPKRILEVGGGAKPAIPLQQLSALGVLEYAIIDVSQEELNKAPSGYTKICCDVSADELPVAGGYDLVISRMLAEHIAVPRNFHGNVMRLLAPGGRAFHFFATMFSPVYLLNRILPEFITERLVLFADRNRTQNGTNDKFRAYYRWCYGPTSRQIQRFRNMGFEIETYRGFFGHGYYNRIPGLKQLHELLTSYLLKRPLPYLTTVAYLVLRKPIAS